MRATWLMLLGSALAWGQAASTPRPGDASAPAIQAEPGNQASAGKSGATSEANVAVIPAGTKVPLTLAQAIST